MTRFLRIQFPDGIHHVPARGTGRQTLFTDEIDHERFLVVLGNVVIRHRVVGHAYCRMANHYHLLHATPHANLAHAMHRLKSRFTQYFNHRHQRPGHVLQGCSDSQIVDRDSDLREMRRNIALNPVRAGLVAHPREWRWSSYRAEASEASMPASLSANWVLSSTMLAAKPRPRSTTRDS